MKKTLFLSFLLLLSVNGCKEKLGISCGISGLSEVGINHVRPVIGAMEKYKADNGKYPKNALDLIPKYIDKVPIIIHSSENIDDTNKYNILINDKIRGGVPWIAEKGDYYRIEFYPNDERFCLLGGRNNICEYTSETKQWGCYQH